MLDGFFKKKIKIDYQKLPRHIGFIMDGNGRWAKRRGLPRSAGHKFGADTFDRIVDFCDRLGIEVATFYAFSTENWKRSKEELRALFEILEDYLDNGFKKIEDKNIKVRVIGDRSAFSPEFVRKIENIEKKTEGRTGLLVNIALNYGGRSEIARASRLIAQKVKDGKIRLEDINEELLSEHMYTAGQPDPDLIIRPSGEYRLSNFLLWQAAYSELWFSKIMWPDFKDEDLLMAISDYQKRNRRFGAVGD